MPFFQVSMEYPNSGTRSRILTGEDGIIGKALQNGSNIATKVSEECPTIAQQFYDIEAKHIKKELQLLASIKDNHSILRKKDEASLLSFSWQNLHAELKKKAPNFLRVLRVLCGNDEAKMKTELPAILSAGSTLIAVYNREMSALEYKYPC
jgi:hypothetical protein